MDIRQITDRFFAAPQIDAADFTALAEAGFGLVINNRPDGEVGPDQHSETMRAAAEAAGLRYVVNPLTMETMTPDRQTLQRDSIAACDGKVLAYCRSGTRSTICWALAHATEMEPTEIINAAAQGGYDISGLAPHLQSLKSGN
ncbi:TIGR01244 family sulfur transferase [Shimia marina]|uniref:Beta-lactamase hydrolase-like protein n=1 Tax=Shimia marina TaxID=321267 RepID=A0A0P1EQH3_9RHOB|nr:TIGR01244 family sulfur transferase [Shimia marina]CUH52736.1 Beta-lactamase hydrolase-like protein [Shimia marina]SFE79547.1 TIGR01244 family protein [Shimia marina]